MAALGAVQVLAPTEPLISPAGGLSVPTSTRGSYVTAETQIERSRGPAQVVGFGSQPALNGNAVRYKMTGYYAAGAAWEVWFSVSTPNPNPPSGHVLVAISYVQIA
jgi:hypothetical protein